MLLCFPASIFFLTGIKNHWKKNNISQIMSLLFLTVIVIFFIVQTKIIHYSSLIYIPGCFFSAIIIEEYLDKKKYTLSILEWFVFICSSLTYLFATLLLPILINKHNLIIPYINDINTVASITQKLQWEFTGFIPGLFLLCIFLIVILLFIKKNITLGIKILIISSMIFTNLIWAFFLPNLEKYTQRDLINYYKNISNEKIDLTTYNYKTYAHMFYANKKVYKSIEEYKNSKNKEQILHIITRKNSQTQFENEYSLKLIHEFGQFLIYEYKE